MKLTALALLLLACYGPLAEPDGGPLMAEAAEVSLDRCLDPARRYFEIRLGSATGPRHVLELPWGAARLRTTTSPAGGPPVVDEFLVARPQFGCPKPPEIWRMCAHAAQDAESCERRLLGGEHEGESVWMVRCYLEPPSVPEAVGCSWGSP